MIAKDSTQHKQVNVNRSAKELKDCLNDMPSVVRSDAESQLDSFEEKIGQYTWQQLYDQSTRNPKKKTGFNWEYLGEKTADGHKLHSVRLSSKIRIIAFREKDEMIVLGFYNDHDKTYKRR